MFKRHLCLLALVLAPTAAHAQASPNAGLPPMLLECDTTPGAIGCAAWIGDGHEYDATWANGTIGHLTVTSGSSSALVIERKDTTGVLAGLTGTYTGTWTGKEVNDPKFVWTYQGKTTNFTWIAVPATVPASCIAPGYIVNWYKVPLTAYVVSADPKADRTVLNISNGTNDLRNKGREWPPIGPFGRDRDQNCYNATTYGFSSHITAGIFADGSAFGDRKQIDTIMAARAKAQHEYHELASQVCTVAQRGLALSEIMPAINNLHPPNSPALQLLQHNLARPARTPADGKARILNAVKELQVISNGLLDPVKDEHGKLYIDEKPDEQACTLP